ncbi:hypothetical protein Ade02nite_67090 [Paractinoplanes deccanensis]|uniref:Uncharacterized protein n=2 Tax=Paractinoplanes deccanensis TaxID=113561 RepID=A0ABQ3YDI2_9ACTN|nr:hypothetical protein Ade02nite_67090 [Actinoplanes deccanensis]
MPRSRTMLKRDAAFIVLGIEALAIVGVVYFLVTLDWMSVIWSLSIAIAIPSWLLAVKAPTYCGVTTQAGGKCTRPVNGVIFGCGTSEHTWAKFFSRFGWRRQPDPNRASAKAGPAAQMPRFGGAPTGDAGVVTVRIAEEAKSKVAFWMALTATLCALISATVDVTSAIN